MEKRTREIIALVLLLVLGVGIAAAMAWYILVGHGWNHAATHIDDMVGSMDGYTVVVFDGVVKQPKSDADKDKLEKGKSKGSGKAAPEKKKPKPTSDAVAAGYREKGAATLVLDLKKLGKYEDPSILKRGSKRIGVFSSTGPLRKRVTSVRAKIRYLERHRVDLIIVLADDRSMMTDRIGGANLLLLAKGGGLPSKGAMKGSLFCVDSPYKGEVQSVIISPSNVMTSQTVKEL